MALTTNATEAMLFALYDLRFPDGTKNVVVLQAMPGNLTLPMSGGFVVIMGDSDAVSGMNMFDYHQATQFITEPRGPGELRLMHRRRNRRLTVRATGGSPTFWLAPQNQFDDAPWRLDAVQEWRDGPMDNADLSYVLGLRHRIHSGQSFKGTKLDYASFTSAFLGNARFNGASCVGTAFNNADLAGADFTGANLTDAIFSGVDARGAKFPGAKFSAKSFDRTYAMFDTRFEKAVLTKAVLDGCSLGKVCFTGATLDEASFKKADLLHADFTDASAARVAFDEANAAGALFKNANLTGATFRKTRIGGSTFKASTLTDASFENASLDLPAGSPLVDFTSATLYHIDFSGCDLRMATIVGRPAFHRSDAPSPDSSTNYARFKSAQVPLAVIGETNWRMLDLTGATIHGSLKTLRNFQGHYAILPDNYSFADGIDLTGAKFVGARLRGARLSGAKATAVSGKPETFPDFTGADLTSAKMASCVIWRTIFTNAIMHGVNLSGSELSYAMFNGARLDSKPGERAGASLVADLSQARLTETNFKGAYLNGSPDSLGANLSLVRFSGTMADATLTRAVFTGAYLAAVDFSGAKLKSMAGVNFAGTCLVNCNFKGVSLQQAILTGACLLGADFTDADLGSAKMASALIAGDEMVQDENTLAIEGFTVPISLAYQRTIIVESMTDDATTCPNRDNGPCAEASLRRVRGPQVWQYKAKSTMTEHGNPTTSPETDAHALD
ncbi:uncharacterized protein YjbI with pentapeptide repeats [Luteibacter sp. Sphag1AF]|uniref:pentapeptide repeat-containing protein n=1 Tax=Luteibacter sp. Sphag1AF TaxID=2587031 RepID=UPI0016153883|nr:uncharacterized protein YjbI with pentapeptide repeats [Luteibacter sp. Sphag1AF]